MNELLEAARAVIAWHERWPTSVPGQCPRMPDGKALACRCNTVCCHERLRMAIAVEDGKTYFNNMVKFVTLKQKGSS